MARIIKTKITADFTDENNEDHKLPKNIISTSREKFSSSSYRYAKIIVSLFSYRKNKGSCVVKGTF